MKLATGGQGQSLESPTAGASLLVLAGSCHSRLQGCCGPWAGVCSLVGRAGARPGSLYVVHWDTRVWHPCTDVWGWVLGPLVDGAMSRGDFRLWGSEASLLAGECGCVPAWLIAWPKGSWYWYLQAGGMGQGWVPRLVRYREDSKMAAVSVSPG